MRNLTKLLALVVALALAPLGVAAVVTALDQAPVTGRVTGLDNQQRLLVVPDGSPTSVGIALDAVEEVDFGRMMGAPDDKLAPYRVVLTDGSIFYGSLGDTEREGVFKVATLKAGTFTVDVNDVARIERREVSAAGVDAMPADGSEWLFHQVSGKGVPCDVFDVKSGGALLAIAGDKGDGTQFEWSRIRSLVRKPAKLDPFTRLFGIFTTVIGDVVQGTVVKWDAGNITIETRFAGRTELKDEAVSSVVFKNGRFVYLSDLDPDKAEEYPYIRGTDFDPKDYLFTYKRDRAQGGGALSIGGKRHAKGLGVHAVSRLAYKAGKKYTKLTAVIGVDDSAGQLASVTFSVLVDGKPVDMTITPLSGDTTPRKAKDSGIMRRTTGGYRIEVDVANATDVTLVVEAADQGDVNDRANWAGVKFVR